MSSRPEGGVPKRIELKTFPFLSSFHIIIHLSICTFIPLSKRLRGLRRTLGALKKGEIGLKGLRGVWVGMKAARVIVEGS